MIEFQHRVEIAGTREQVFALLTDVERMPEWQANVTSVTKAGEGPVGANTEFEQRWRVLGRERRVPSRVTAWKQNELLAVTGDAGFADYYCGFELVSLDAERTQLTSRAEFRLHGIWKLLRPILGGELRREMAAELESFGVLVAQEHGVPRSRANAR